MLAARGQIALGCGGAYSRSLSRMRVTVLGGAANTCDQMLLTLSLSLFLSLSLSLSLSPSLSLSRSLSSTLSLSLPPSRSPFITFVFHYLSFSLAFFLPPSVTPFLPTLPLSPSLSHSRFLTMSPQLSILHPFKAPFPNPSPPCHPPTTFSQPQVLPPFLLISHSPRLVLFAPLPPTPTASTSLLT